MGNLDLHLIKGRPAVHADDDLIVSHIAITVSLENMEALRQRLDAMGVKARKNVSVPNPTITDGPDKGRVDQVGLIFCILVVYFKSNTNQILCPIIITIFETLL